MDQVKWKVCGLRDNIKEVLALQPDYAGFIFYPKSPRFVGSDFNMPDLDQKSTKKIGVFVNASIETVKEIVEKYQLDFVQLHGNESPKYCKKIKLIETGVIKAFQIAENFKFEQLQQYNTTVDYFLFDTKTKAYGGSGITFNWEILKKYDMEKSYFLSGGISLNNLERLKEIDMHKVHALDVNSKFEIEPGLKDIKMLKKLKAELELGMSSRTK